jgi:hypothetical protein
MNTNRLKLIPALTFLMLIGSVSTTFAQLKPLVEASSFFMGKRHTLGLDLMGNVINHPNKSSKESQFVSDPKLKVFGKFTFTRAISNGKSFSLLYSRDRTSRNQIGNLYYRESDNITWSKESGNPLLTRNSLGFRINYHFKSRGNLAPIGNHFSAGLRLHFVDPNYSNYSLSLTSNDQTSLVLTDFEENYHYITADFSYTYRTMFRHNLFFDMGVNVSLPIHYIINKYVKETPEHRFKNQLFEAMKNRYALTDVGSLSLGIGFLLE